MGFRLIVHEIFESQDKAIGEFLIGARDEIPKPIGFEPEPKSFDRIEIRRVGRKINRFKVMPV